MKESSMPSLLVIDDDASVLQIFRRVFQDTDTIVHTAQSGSEGLELVKRHRPDTVILDIVLPDESGLEMFEKVHRLDPKVPVIFITAGGASDTAIEAMKLGAFDYLLKPLDFPKVRELVGRAFEIRRFMHVPVAMSEDSQSNGVGDALIGRCPAMQEVYKAIGRVAPQNVTVLIHGESGTGKELIARAIYQHSPRAAGRFLAVNCAAIPEALLESELFGHEKGSFTGADSKRIGKFEQCSGGTLFLDEVGDMTPLVQSKVLRVLQEQRFERVGGNETIATDVRIIAATNRDLETMVGKSEFRPDLYYRLNGFSIKLPPLRERSEDIVVLLEHFLHRFSRELGKDVCDVSPGALDCLIQYRWPGNVREFQSVLKQAILQAIGPVLLPGFLPPAVRSGDHHHNGESHSPRGEIAALETFVDERIAANSTDLHAEMLAYVERIVLTRVLRHTNANQSTAAKILGITRGSLRNKIRTLGIRIDQVVNIADQPSKSEVLEPVG
jgi:two-component system, NtrC family, nitrogen regulation response regulator GlnG